MGEKMKEILEEAFYNNEKLKYNVLNSNSISNLLNDDNYLNILRQDYKKYRNILLYLNDILWQDDRKSLVKGIKDFRRGWKRISQSKRYYLINQLKWNETEALLKDHLICLKSLGIIHFISIEDIMIGLDDICFCRDTATDDAITLYEYWRNNNLIKNQYDWTSILISISYTTDKNGRMKLFNSQTLKNRKSFLKDEYNEIDCSFFENILKINTNI